MLLLFKETLTISKFCDWLQNKGVSREEAARVSSDREDM